MTEDQRTLDLEVADLRAENATLKAQLALYKQHNEDLMVVYEDREHNNDIDVQDSRRFRFIVQAALAGDESFIDRAEALCPNPPESLAVVRSIIDTLMVQGVAHVNG